MCWDQADTLTAEPSWPTHGIYSGAVPYLSMQDINVMQYYAYITWIL